MGQGLDTQPDSALDAYFSNQAALEAEAVAAGEDRAAAKAAKHLAKEYCCESCRASAEDGANLPCEGCSTDNGESGCATGACAMTSGAPPTVDSDAAIAAAGESAMYDRTARLEVEHDQHAATVALGYSDEELALISEGIGPSGDLVSTIAASSAQAGNAAQSAAQTATGTSTPARASSSTTTTTTTTSTSTRTPGINAQDARNWVETGVGILQGRLAEGDRGREREYLERMAAQQFADNANRREFEAKLAEINGRYGNTPSSTLPAVMRELSETIQQQQQPQSSGVGAGVMLGSLALVAGMFGIVLTMKK